jgi:hypothetical protein
MDQDFINHTKRTKDVMNLIKKCVNFWVPVVGLDQWASVSITFSYENHDEGKSILALTNSMWQYMRAEITFYLPAVITSGLDDDGIEHVVVHELCHCLVDEMGMEEDATRRQQVPHEERVVTNLSMSFLKLASALKEKEKRKNVGAKVLSR